MMSPPVGTVQWANVSIARSSAQDEANRLSGGTTSAPERIKAMARVAPGAVVAGVDVLARDARGLELQSLESTQIDVRFSSRGADDDTVLPSGRHGRSEERPGAKECRS